MEKADAQLDDVCREPVVSDGLITEEELEKEANELSKTVVGFLWPITKRETKRFSILAVAFSLIATLYTWLRQFKDAAVYNVLESSAGNWLKLLTFFASLFVVGIIQNQCAKRGINKTFEHCMGGFAVAFVFMGLIAIVMNMSWFPAFRLMWAQEKFIGERFTIRGLSLAYIPCLIFNHWPVAFFYVFYEVLPSLAVSYLFMTFLSFNTTTGQSKRFIRILYICSNTASALISEGYKRVFGKWNSYYNYALFYILFSFGAAGVFLIVLGLKKLLDAELEKPIIRKDAEVKKPKSKKAKVSMIKGLELCFKSKFLLAISSMTLFYNVCTNLLTALTNASYASAADATNQKKADVSNKYKPTEFIITNVSVIIVLLSPVARIYEWYGIGLSSSIALVLSLIGLLSATYGAGVNFNSCGKDVMKFSIIEWLSDMEKNPMTEVRLNLGFSAALKVSKYAFFDIVKEAISMKIDPGNRTLFKGVFDGVVGKLGKCAGAVYNIAMEGVTTSRDCRYYAPITLLMVMSFCVVWFAAIVYLHKKYKKVANNKNYLSPDYFNWAKDEFNTAE
ncbi:ATP:ADP antiporter, AAA family [Enteropsectra breve]|nr:ATP:ADP antiporter, AAA family [Enteropsectra breve]